MEFEVKKPILGFENITKVEFEKIDELFATLSPANSKLPSFTLVNPYQLKEYSFDIPKDVQVLMDIKEDSKILVYNIVVLHNPITQSVVNFKAPLIFNMDNQTMAQFIIDEEGFYTIKELLTTKDAA